MKIVEASRLSKHAHHNYRIPYIIALEIIRRHGFNDLHACVIGNIKNYIDYHGKTLDNPVSLSKRIVGGIKDHFCRLFVDRQMLNWLCENRMDLREVDGELRNYIANRMLAEIHQQDRESKCQPS